MIDCKKKIEEVFILIPRMEEKIVFLLFAPHKNITFYYVNVFYNVNVNSLFLNGEGQVYIEKTNEFSIIRCY